MRIEEVITSYSSCYTNSPCQPLWKCIENNIENMHSDVKAYRVNTSDALP